MNKIPYEFDVWDVIETELATGLDVIQSVEFDYSAKSEITQVVIEHFKKDGPAKKIITTSDDNLVLILCNKFNIPTTLASLKFTLKPAEVPLFKVELYPYVDDANTLKSSKSRWNPKTVD